MQFNRKLFFFTVAILIYSSTAYETDEDKGDEYKGTLPLFHSNRPRIISIFSKPADPDAPKETGPNIFGHIGNVIHGGSIGVEVRPISGIQGIISHAKKIIPGGGGHPQVGTPEHQKPPPEVYEPPKGGHWEEKKDWVPENPSKPPPEVYEPPKGGHWEDKKDWVPENPSKPVPEGPSWEDIGEDPEDDPSIPYEDVINPRLKPHRRPKRAFRNSKIYHLPLAFLSNGKPFKVKFSSSKFRDDKSVNGLF